MDPSSDSKPNATDLRFYASAPGRVVSGYDGKRGQSCNNSLLSNKQRQEHLKGIKKPKVKVTSRCRCGDLLTYHCVVQCEKCWKQVVEQHEQARAAARAQEASWSPAPGSAAADAAASSAPTVGPVQQTQLKFCTCGAIIRHHRFDKCFHCGAKEKQLKASADQANDKLLESLKAEVAQKQRELAKLQLKEADEAFERTQRAVDDGSWHEDSQSD